MFIWHINWIYRCCE